MDHLKDLIRESAQDPSPFIKALNYVAAALGVGTFLQLVNVAVGLLSGAWLAAQLYGYVRYELPHKRARLKAALKELEDEEPD